MSRPLARRMAQRGAACGAASRGACARQMVRRRRQSGSRCGATGRARGCSGATRGRATLPRRRALRRPTDPPEPMRRRRQQQRQQQRQRQRQRRGLRGRRQRAGAWGAPGKTWCCCPWTSGCCWELQPRPAAGSRARLRRAHARRSSRLPKSCSVRCSRRRAYRPTAPRASANGCAARRSSGTRSARRRRGDVAGASSDIGAFLLLSVTSQGWQRALEFPRSGTRARTTRAVGARARPLVTAQDTPPGRASADSTGVG